MAQKLDEEFNDERRLVENDSRDQRRAMEKEFREQRMEEEREGMEQEKEFREQMERDRHDDHDDFMKMVPPEDFESVERIKNTIMAVFSMEEIEKYWENDREGLLSEILSRTDLTRDGVEKVFGYAERYDDRHEDDYDIK